MANKRALNTKGISVLISTVLLILLSTSAIVIIAGIIIPYVKNSLGEKENCLDTRGKFKLVAESTCYTLNPTQTTNVVVKFSTIDTDEIYIILEGEGGSKSFKLKEDESHPEVSSPNPITMPTINGGERIYTFNGKYTFASIAPIIKGNACEISDSIEIREC